MELKDLLPLLIIIGSVVFSFLQKKKKQAQDPEMESEKSIWETLLGDEEEMVEPRRHTQPEQEYDEDEDSWFEKDESVVEVIERTQFVGSKPKVSPVETIKDVERIASHMSDSPILKHDITKKNTSVNKPDFKNKRDLKKGIIFSEIIKRKEY